MVSTEQGLFYREMRHLSKLVLRLEKGALLLLSSSVRLDNAVLAVDLTNSELLEQLVHEICHVLEHQPERLVKIRDRLGRQLPP